MFVCVVVLIYCFPTIGERGSEAQGALMDFLVLFLSFFFPIALNSNAPFLFFAFKRYSFADTSFRIVLSLEFYLGTTLWFRFCLAPVAAYLGLTNTPVAENVDWMGSLVLGFSHTTAFAFGNFLYQDYYRRGFDKKPEYAFIKYYSIYGSIFVIGRMTTQVLCSMRSKLLQFVCFFVFMLGGVERSGVSE